MTYAVVACFDSPLGEFPAAKDEQVRMGKLCVNCLRCCGEKRGWRSWERAICLDDLNIILMPLLIFV